MNSLASRSRPFLPICVLLGVCTALAPAPASLASDDLGFPGAVCRASAASYSGDMQYTSQGSIRNASNSDSEVECPLIKDYSADADGFDDLQAWVYVPSGGSVDCWAYACDHGDPLGGCEYSAEEVSVGSGVNTLDWNASLDGVPYGYYFMHCSLSHNAKILSIWANENDT